MRYTNKVIAVSIEAMTNDPQDCSVESLGILKISIEFPNNEEMAIPNNALTVLVKPESEALYLSKMEDILCHVDTLSEVRDFINFVEEEDVKYDRLKVYHFAKEQYLCGIIAEFLDLHGVAGDVHVLSDNVFAADWLREIGVDVVMGTEHGDLNIHMIDFERFMNTAIPIVQTSSMRTAMFDGPDYNALRHLVVGDIVGEEIKAHLLATTYHLYKEHITAKFKAIQAQAQVANSMQYMQQPMVMPSACSLCPHGTGTITFKFA